MPEQERHLLSVACIGKREAPAPRLPRPCLKTGRWRPAGAPCASYSVPCRSPSSEQSPHPGGQSPWPWETCPLVLDKLQRWVWGFCHSPTYQRATTYQKAKQHSCKEAPNEAFPGLLRRQLWTENKFLAEGILVSLALEQWILVKTLLITSPSKIPPYLVSLFPTWLIPLSFLSWSSHSNHLIILKNSILIKEQYSNSYQSPQNMLILSIKIFYFLLV